MIGELRRDSPGLDEGCRAAAIVLEAAGIVHVTFAAEMSAHPILAVNVEMIAASPESPGRCVGKLPPGVEPAGFTFWSVGSWENRSAWLEARCFHDVSYVREKLVENEVDAVAIAELLNRIELRRGAEFGFDLEDALARWRENLAARSVDG